MKEKNDGLHLTFLIFYTLFIQNSCHIMTVLSDVITHEETFSYGRIKTGFSKSIKIGLGVLNGSYIKDPKGRERSSMTRV